MEFEYTFTINDEEGNEIDYDLLLTFEYDGEEYAALAQSDVEEISEVILYRYWEEGGEPRIEEIPDDEADEVEEVFQAILEEMEE